MSDVDPLIKREMQWMALGVLENRDLAPIIIAKVRRQRIRRALFAVLAVVAIGATSIGIFEFLQKPAPIVVASDSGVTGTNADSQPEIIGLQSDYPVTWEQSVGDLGAISGAGGIGDTLGGLTAVGLKISWERCGQGQCPVTWVLSLENRTQDLISTAPSLGLFTNHTPIVSDSRPTTVLPGGTALLVYSFPEFKESLQTSPRETWQWNWYLAQLR
ncbi:MAG: hypothetical protein F2750_03665 [Actinobacteria bacterium]|jgi:hypothetical protein|uniref:Unannotated protein n=1 Tax=freshwater metagenome TaxID=449393 RepID=A0A6J6Z5L3_9ZZZZ|nr:hypothetical protein [Actinomycetota bacterium]